MYGRLSFFVQKIRGGADDVRISITDQTGGGLSTLPYLQAVCPVTDHRPEHSHRRGLRSFLFYGALQLCKFPYILPPHRRDQLHDLSRGVDMYCQGADRMVPDTLPAPDA